MSAKFFHLLCLACLLEVSLAIPPPAPGNHPVEVVETRPARHPLFRRLSLKSRYVDHSGSIHYSNPGGCSVRVDATYAVSDHALQLAATTISRMVRHMPSAIFNRVCSHTKVGVFTHSEGLIVYPEYAEFKNPAGCGSGCQGSCHHSCTFDGRKYQSLAGTGGPRAVILDDNVLCDGADPYFRKSNILVHEYAHTIMGFALSSDYKAKITAAYNAARNRGTWGSGYHMSNPQEYWAVASSAYFNAEHNAAKTDMNSCGGSLCASEAAARYQIYQKDTNLYNVLGWVYGTAPGNLGPCTR